MPRWEPDGFERLQSAALELFAEQGFERTTVAEIAGRAGLTPRTFFNHFADKREVLFGLSSDYQQAVVRGIADCADDLSPLDAVVHALRAATDATFEHRRDVALRRHAIVDANRELRERELGKQAALTDAVAAALRARGVDPDTAFLAAGAAMLVQQGAFQKWAQAAGTRPLREFLLDALDALRLTVGAP